MKLFVKHQQFTQSILCSLVIAGLLTACNGSDNNTDTATVDESTTVVTDNGVSYDGTTDGVTM